MGLMRVVKKIILRHIDNEDKRWMEDMDHDEHEETSPMKYRLNTVDQLVLRLARLPNGRIMN
jgi:hypothetical protein